MNQSITVDKVRFPVITFDRFAFNVVPDLDKLTRTTSAGLANGLFKNLQIIDSDGTLYFVTAATKVKGIGPFWGYTIFLNQNIRLNLVLSTETRELKLPEMKAKVISAINKKRDFWSSGGNVSKIRSLVNDAASIEDLIQKLDTVVHGRPTYGG
ncbi:MAG: hypothetical protein J7619_31320 [Dyadobacter sp.]|uniref:hypothetical protein n=1 Tax=Dyadobacter sp. TaxID=1914288 RepID=UPI001B27DA18|nr:hypothetical protein [Dyadobacter sp.]MBO9617218.1 hypothetical protein [Dyadobacter sp.]